jgi:hypothetical protein
MVRKMLRAGLFAALGLIGMVATYGVAMSANADKVNVNADADISDVMKKSFKDKDAYNKTIPAAVKGEKWEDAAKLAKEWNELAMALAKNKPPKGEAKSWEKLCGGFVDNTKTILEGAEKKDAKVVTKAIGSFNCMACHKNHKGS